MIPVYELTSSYTISDYIDNKKTTPIFELDSNKEIYDILERNGEFYSVCCKSRDDSRMAVKKLEKFDTDAEETDEDEWTCPYCGYVNHDAFEYDDEENNHRCPSCGCTVNTIRNIMITYNVEPVKAKEVIKLEEE